MLAYNPATSVIALEALKRCQPARSFTTERLWHIQNQLDISDIMGPLKRWPKIYGIYMDIWVSVGGAKTKTTYVGVITPFFSGSTWEDVVLTFD